MTHFRSTSVILHVFFLASILVVLNGTAVVAQNERALGKSHYTFEMDVMVLQHRTFETDDGGGYVGLAGYGHLGNNWYLGGEIGVGFGLGILSDTSSYIPIELNAKKAIPLSPNWVVDVGGGLSYNQVEVSHDSWFSDNDWDYSEWVFGGQLMCDFYFKAGKFLVGLVLKYQLTADLPEVSAAISPDEGWDYSNFKIGLQLGFLIPD